MEVILRFYYLTFPAIEAEKDQSVRSAVAKALESRVKTEAIIKTEAIKRLNPDTNKKNRKRQPETFPLSRNNLTLLYFNAFTREGFH